jgi:3-isopropylmalate/(R)-2-methylmalate dehydratase small subunit
MSNFEIKSIVGTGVPVKGNDIDTDRIIPARFLKCVTFEALGPESFKDDRFDEKGKAKEHSFNNQAYQGASVLLVNKNFGCGSSREHAPQALNRWGIKAIAGESFAEIFYGNCIAMGVPCMVFSHDDIEAASAIITKNPKAKIEINVEKQTMTVEGKDFKGFIPDGSRGQLLNGSWDATFQLLENESDVKAIANSLPYVNGWQ